MSSPVKIVIDTSVLVAACFGSHSTEIIKQWEAGQLILCYSKAIRGEYEAVLHRIPPIREPVTRFFIALDSSPHTFFVEKPPFIKVDIEDPNDVKFVSCAVGAGADYVVTLDDHLLFLRAYDSVTICRPSDFFQRNANTQ